MWGLNDDVFVVTCFLVIFLLICGILIVSYKYSVVVRELKGMNKLYDILPMKYRGDFTGVYFPGDGFYCVWTRGRSADDIRSTDVHESCHNLVRDRNEHFC